jgi:CRP/FNR family transcriptional regulator, cyclic AMP receptor protein
VLKGVSLFHEWSAGELAEFATYLSVASFEAREVVFWEGDPGDKLYIIAEGTVIVSRKIKGNVEAVITRLSGGEFFGELDVIDDLSASATLQTETNCIFFTIGRLELYERLEAAPRLYGKFLLALLKVLAKRLRGTNNKLNEAILWGIDATSLDTG